MHKQAISSELIHHHGHDGSRFDGTGRVHSKSVACNSSRMRNNWSCQRSMLQFLDCHGDLNAADLMGLAEYTAKALPAGAAAELVMISFVTVVITVFG